MLPGSAQTRSDVELLGLEPALAAALAAIFSLGRELVELLAELSLDRLLSAAQAPHEGRGQRDRRLTAVSK